MESFYQDTEDCGNPVTFGMRLYQEDLPEYGEGISVRGLDVKQADQFDSKFIGQALEYRPLSSRDVVS